MRSPIDIHEFSTGITFQLTDNGGRWVSHGFTKKFMSNTLEQLGRSIPPEVKKAIAEQNFAVSGGAVTDKPTIIAHDMPNSPWSVIAVVSCGEDAKGNRAMFYRFFLCEEPVTGYDPGEDGISILLSWMTEQWHQSKQWPQFHPQLRERPLGYYIQSPYAAQPSAILEKKNLLDNAQTPPHIWKANTGCVPLLLHELSKYMKPAGQSLAWAFNASALANPRSFTIIYPNNVEAEKLIQQAIANPLAVKVADSTKEQATDIRRLPVDIHEFSTGINFQLVSSDGRWISRGFTGQYMNNTLAQRGSRIPPEVERAISDRKFAVSEGAYTKDPAIIARDLPESPWSVIAVVSRGEDEKGRSASFYRYFLCKEPTGGYKPGEDGILILLNWMTERKKKTKQWPHFHPQPPAGAPGYFVKEAYAATSEAIIEKQAFLKEDQAPYIWAANTGCVPLTLHGLTKFIRQEGQPLAWAFNAGALENPWSFTIISPADTKAEGLIRRAIVNPPAVRIAGNTSESALNTAIKTLTTLSSIRPDAVKVLFGAAKSGQVPDEAWIELFDKRGAKNSITHKIYDPERIKLMTLRALILPSRLLSFMDWFGLSDPKRKLQAEETIYVDFQQRLSAALEHVQLSEYVNNQVYDSIVQFLLPDLLDRAITPDSTYQLLSNEASFWGRQRSHLLSTFETYAEYIYDNATNIRREHNRSSHNEKLWYGVYALRGIPVSGSRYSRSTYYEPLIELLIAIGNEPFPVEDKEKAYRLAAYFTHVSRKLVSSELYRKAFPFDNPNETIYLKERIKRSISFSEKAKNELWNFLNMQIKMMYVLLISGFMLVLGGIGGGAAGVLYARRTDVSNPIDSDPNLDQDTGGARNPGAENNSISSEDWIEDALSQYENTATLLEETVVNVSNNLPKNVLQGSNYDTIKAIAFTKIIEDILQTGNSVSSDYSIALNARDNAQQIQLITKIKEYEMSTLNQSESEADGVINTNEMKEIEAQAIEIMKKESQ